MQNLCEYQLRVLTSVCLVVSFWLAVKLELEIGIFVIQMNPLIASFLLLVIASHKSRVDTRKEKRWARPGFISVVCGSYTEFSCFHLTSFFDIWTPVIQSKLPSSIHLNGRIDSK